MTSAFRQQDVQRKVEPARDFERRGHASANDAEHECVTVGAVRRQDVSQFPARCAEVDECDVPPHLRNDLSVHGATQSGTDTDGQLNDLANLQPYLTFYFCITLQGVFPPRG